MDGVVNTLPRLRAVKGVAFAPASPLLWLSRWCATIPRCRVAWPRVGFGSLWQGLAWVVG